MTIRGVIERTALLTRAEGPSAAVLVHQTGRTAESWNDFALWLQRLGVSSLALQSNSAEDVQTGVEYLMAEGYTDLVLIGASIGGSAIQNALSEADLTEITHVVLLGTGTGKALRDPQLHKLFFGSENDFFQARVTTSFSKASAPKSLILLTGDAHGQDLLESPHANQVLREISEFLDYK